VRHFRLDLSEAVSAAIAAEVVHRVGKPVVNAAADENTKAFVSIPARHGTRFGGTNGTLRFRDEGIDYVTGTTGASRSWRWADIQTLANPDPYRFRVGGYLETFDFELKQPLSREVFDTLWDRVYARDLNISANQEGEQHAGR
jgi:hypothetical protein